MCMCLYNFLYPVSEHFCLVHFFIYFFYLQQWDHWARQDCSHYILAFSQADGKTDDPHSSHSWPSIFISWLLAPQTPHVYHFSTRALAVGRASDAHKCLENKNRHEDEKKESQWERTQEKKSCERWEGKQVVSRSVFTLLELLNNFTLIKDNSKSMCCCELLFMTKGLGQCRLTWFIRLLWVPINERSDWPSEQLHRMALHSLPLISCYFTGEAKGKWAAVDWDKLTESPIHYRHIPWS